VTVGFLPFVATVGNVPVPLPVADGGTGQATAAAALSALGGALTCYRQAASAITPNATLNVFGNAVTIGADTGFTGFSVFLVNFVTTGFGSETVTLQSVVTFSDNTTNTQAGLTTFTTSTTTSAALNTIIAMVGSVDAKTVKTIAFSVKSSINNSTASLTVNVLGVNLP